MKKYLIPSCCGKSNTVIKLDFPISKYNISIFENTIFSVSENFLKSGIVKLESKNLIATCPINTNKIKIQCKLNDCTNDLIELDKILNCIK